MSDASVKIACSARTAIEARVAALEELATSLPGMPHRIAAVLPRIATAGLSCRQPALQRAFSLVLDRAIRAAPDALLLDAPLRHSGAEEDDDAIPVPAFPGDDSIAFPVVGLMRMLALEGGGSDDDTAARRALTVAVMASPRVWYRLLRTPAGAPQGSPFSAAPVTAAAWRCLLSLTDAALHYLSVS